MPCKEWKCPITIIVPKLVIYMLITLIVALWISRSHRTFIRSNPMYRHTPILFLHGIAVMMSKLIYVFVFFYLTSMALIQTRDCSSVRRVTLRFMCKLDLNETTCLMRTTYTYSPFDDRCLFYGNNFVCADTFCFIFCFGNCSTA